MNGWLIVMCYTRQWSATNIQDRCCAEDRRYRQSEARRTVQNSVWKLYSSSQIMLL